MATLQLLGPRSLLLAASAETIQAISNGLRIGVVGMR
jgi:hypothetical protein